MDLKEYQNQKEKIRELKKTGDYTALLDLQHELIQKTTHVLSNEFIESLVAIIREYLYESLITLDYIKSVDPDEE